MSTVWDKLDEPGRYTETGEAIPLVADQGTEGETDSSASPDKPDATPAAGAENTTASKSSPGAVPAAGEVPPAKAAEPAASQPGSELPAKAAAAGGAEQTAEEDEAALKTRLSKPEDQGEEWWMRAFREGEKLRKQLGPVNDKIEKIGSAERVSRGLDFIAEFAEPDVPIETAATKMTALFPSRTQALQNHFYNTTLDEYPDAVATDLLVEPGKQVVPVTVAELREGLALLRGGATAKDATQSTGAAALDITKIEVPKPDGMEQGDWDDVLEDAKNGDAFAKSLVTAMQELIAAAQTAAAPAGAKEEPPVNPELKAVRDKLAQLEAAERTKFVEAEAEKVVVAGGKFHEEVFSVVHDGLRELGLEPNAADDERTRILKADTAKAIIDAVEPEVDGPDGPEGWTDWSLCTAEQKENRALAKKIFELLAAGDEAGANDYKDLARLRYDLAFQRVAKAKTEVFNAAMAQPTTTNRNGAGAGTRRPEIVGGAAAGGASTEPNAKTPWLNPDFIKPGEKVGDAMDRYLETHDLPGR